MGPPQDLPRTGPIGIEIVLKVRQNRAPVENRDSTGKPVLRKGLERQLGRQQEGRKGLVFGQPGR